MAVLAVIRDETRATGECTLPVACIAERANVGRAKTRCGHQARREPGADRYRESPRPKARHHQSRCQVSLLSAPIKRGARVRYKAIGGRLGCAHPFLPTDRGKMDAKTI